MNSNQFEQFCSNFSTRPLITPLIMGVLNVTPDSFSDGSHYHQLDNALERAEEMIAEGADIIDIGGESSRPGAHAISSQEELDRVLPVIARLRARHDICISIDTVKPDVMQAAVAAGASMINDISALATPEASAVVAKLDVPVCLMHMQGQPRTMQIQPQYPQGVIHAIGSFLRQRIDVCLAAGIKREKIMIDPGFGFGKTVMHNLQIIKEMKQLQQFQLPILLGVSRKSTIGKLLNKPVNERLVGGLTIAIYAALHGATIFRTHDVTELKQALTLLQAINQSQAIN